MPPATARLETPVRELTDQGVLLADGTERPADVVVVATGAAAAARLLPGLRVPATRSVTTLYHATPASPLAEPTLLVDSEREILHTSVLSEVTPGYASNGRALISTSVLGTGSGSLGPAVRGRLATLYGVGTADCRRLRWPGPCAPSAARAPPASPPAAPGPPHLPRQTAAMFHRCRWSSSNVPSMPLQAGADGRRAPGRGRGRGERGGRGMKCGTTGGANPGLPQH